MSAPRQCAAGHPRYVVTIGVYPRDGETEDEAYAAWARRARRNPWCGHDLDECAEPTCDHSPPPDSAFAWSNWARCACGEVEFRRDSERLCIISDVSMDGMRATDGSDIGSRAKRDAYMKARGLAMAEDFSQTWADKPRRQAEEERRDLKQLTDTIGRVAHTQRGRR